MIATERIDEGKIIIVERSLYVDSNFLINIKSVSSLRFSHLFDGTSAPKVPSISIFTENVYRKYDQVPVTKDKIERVLRLNHTFREGPKTYIFCM